MRVLLRADAGLTQGTGHVMRCLTLAEELVRRGHEVHIMTGPIAIDWLAEVMHAAKLIVHHCHPDELPLERIHALDMDWLVIDSYRIDAALVSAVARQMAVLAIIDGDDRQIAATLYLDQNLGAEAVVRHPESADRYLSGSEYALVRRAVLDARREEPWRIRGDRAKVLCFMGGTDPTGSTARIVLALTQLARDIDLTVIALECHHPAIKALQSDLGNYRIFAPTLELPALMAEAEIIISAAGTSAWDICALGVPAVLVAVVDNQQASLGQSVNLGLVLGLDAVAEGPAVLSQVHPLLKRLLADAALRKQLSRSARAAFDGRGASRVASALERHPSPRVKEANQRSDQ